MTATAHARQDPFWYTPHALPEEITAFDSAVQDGLSVGAAGKVGLLELSLAPSGPTTRIQHEYHRAPLHLFRPIYLDPGRPEMAFVFIQQSGDGLVQGDRYRIDIDCAPNSAVHITTQSATNVYRCRDNFATQLVNLRAGAGAIVEYLPDPLVPFRGSRLFQRTSVTADRTATVIFGDTLLPGRVARDEAHAYDLYRAETEVRRPDGTLLFADVLRLNPSAGDDPTSIGLLGGDGVVAALYVVSALLEPAHIVSHLRDGLRTCPDVLSGVSELPNDCGAAVRLLGRASLPVKRAVRHAWNAARIALLDVPAPDLRKG